MAASAKYGMMGIIFGVLLLVVGLVLSDIIITNVNRQGARIDCFDGNDLLIKNAKGPNTSQFAGPTSANAPSPAVPSKVSATYPGSSVVGKVCGTNVTGASPSATATPLDAFTSPSCSGDACGTIRYTLEVFGADSLNNLFTLIYWIVLVGISLASIGAGGYGVARGYRAM